MSVFIPGHAASVIRDKFLVMSTELQDEKSPSELATLWKTIPKTNIVEHRSANSHAAFLNFVFDGSKLPLLPKVFFSAAKILSVASPLTESQKKTRKKHIPGFPGQRKT